MGLFSNDKNVQDAYDQGQADGSSTRRTGVFNNSGRRPLERDDAEAEAYAHGWLDGNQS